MFSIYKRFIPGTEPFEHLAGAQGLACGTAAVYSGGSLAKCGATQRPSHIVAGQRTEQGEYPAIPVLATTVFATTAGATAAKSLIGSCVTLNATADGVTATTEKGVFCITQTDEADGGGVVKGYFA